MTIPSGSDAARRWTPVAEMADEHPLRALMWLLGLNLAFNLIAAVLPVVLLGAQPLAFGITGILWAGAIVAARRRRNSLGRPLVATTVVLAWMLQEGLVDVEGRLLDEPPRSHDTRHQLVLDAYAMARTLALSRKPWHQPLIDVQREVDPTGELERRIRQDLSRRPFPRITWVVVIPLAALGLALLVLAGLSALAAFYGAAM